MSKKTLFLGGVLLVLIALAYFYQGPLKKWQNSVGLEKNFLSSLRVSQIDRVLVSGPGRQFSFKKEGERWKTEESKDFYLAKDTAEEFFSGLEETAKAEMELVSSNKENKKEFQTDDTGWRVKLYQGEKILADFIVGKQSADFLKVYLAPADSANTYAAETGLLDVLDEEEWRDQTIFSSAEENISKIRFQYPEREFTVEKKNEKWQGTLPYGFPASEDKVKKVLEIMSGLKAVAIPEQTFSQTGLDKHLIIVQATGAGVDNTIMVGEEVKEGRYKGMYYAKRGNSDNIYLISKTERDELDKKVWQLK